MNFSKSKIVLRSAIRIQFASGARVKGKIAPLSNKLDILIGFSTTTEIKRKDNDGNDSSIFSHGPFGIGSDSLVIKLIGFQVNV